MTTDQITLFGILVVLFGLLVWGRFRYDLVAFVALMVTVMAGLIAPEYAFHGFGHPAVVIIALVLIVSRGLMNSGAVEMIARFVTRPDRALPVHIGIMAVAGAVLSAIINNVAALALLMSLDMDAARKARRAVVAHADAPVLRHHPRRHDHADRHAAQHRHRPVPAGGSGRALFDVRLCPGRHRRGDRRHRLCGVHRLAADPQAGRRDVAGRGRRALRRRSAGEGGLQIDRPVGGRPLSGRRRQRCQHSRAGPAGQAAAGFLANPRDPRRRFPGAGGRSEADRGLHGRRRPRCHRHRGAWRADGQIAESGRGDRAGRGSCRRAHHAGAAADPASRGDAARPLAAGPPVPRAGQPPADQGRRSAAPDRAGQEHCCRQPVAGRAAARKPPARGAAGEPRRFWRSASLQPRLPCR